MTISERLNRSEEGKKLLQQERAILEVTELICKLMEEQGITKAQLARDLKTSKAHITQLLDGSRNMTLRTVSDLLYYLKHSLVVESRPMEYATGQVGHVIFWIHNELKEETRTEEKTKTGCSDSALEELSPIKMAG